MKNRIANWNAETELTRLDRMVLHLRRLLLDHKYPWCDRTLFPGKTGCAPLALSPVEMRLSLAQFRFIR